MNSTNIQFSIFNIQFLESNHGRKSSGDFFGTVGKEFFIPAPGTNPTGFNVFCRYTGTDKLIPADGPKIKMMFWVFILPD